ncbi:MAG TPA: chemotaxis protein CheC [Gemmatimonadaceae bacterium]|nr:chemotaxis protein CheC [Gemmatimonadaceae bacterium]
MSTQHQPSSGNKADARAIALMSSERFDALREVANIGAGHAATALSTLTSTRIMISVPMVNVVPPGDFVPEIAPDVEVVAVQMGMSGDMKGRTVFLLPAEAGLRLAERMLRRQRGSSSSLGELEQSALNEAGNILAGAYLTALSEFLKMRLMLSPPTLTRGDTQHALDAFGDHAPRADAPILCVETEFFLDESGENLQGFFLLVPDSDAFDAIFRAVRVA